MNRSDSHSPEIAPRLVLFAPPLDAERAATLVSQACDSADIASIILHTGGKSDAEIVASARRMLPVAIEKSAAMLIEDRADLAEDITPDGVHLSNFPAQSAELSPLKPHFIAGAAGFASRHDAMSAGEAGADYVMFGEPDESGHRPSFEAVVERVEWWAEVFEIPCVGYAAARDEIGVLAGAGADFVAVGAFAFDDPRGLGAAMKDAQALLAIPEAIA